MSVTVGLLPPRARRGRGLRRAGDRPRPGGDRGPGRGAGAAGPPDVPQPHRAREPRGGRAPAARRGGAAPWTLDTRLRAVPAARRAPAPDRRLALGRRAADARHRPRADVEPARAADGRAVGGPGAADRRRGDGDDPPAQGAGPVDRAGRAERASWCSTSPTTSSSSTAAASSSRAPPASSGTTASTCASTSGCTDRDGAPRYRWQPLTDSLDRVLERPHRSAQQATRRSRRSAGSTAMPLMNAAR